MIRKIILVLVIAVVAAIGAVAALHVVAVGGIYAFSALKAARSNPPQAGETAPPAADSSALYTVRKGDTAIAIAKKLQVNYDDLLKLNDITDPGRLQVGRKLRIPAKDQTISHA